MKVPRVAVVAVAISSTLLWLGCGDTFRPVATPVSGGGGDPQNFSMGLVISQGSTGGATSVIDTTGDTNVGNVRTSNAPVHSVLVSTSAGIGAFTASRDSDVLTAQMAQPTSTYPNPVETFNITLADGSGAAVGPVFMHTVSVNNNGTQQGHLYVAGFKSGTVPVVNISVGPPSVIKSIPVGDVNSHPVAITSLPDGSKVYVLNRDAGNVKVISPTDYTVTATIPTGGNPIYALTHPTGNSVYVLSAGSSPTLKVIDPVTDQIRQNIILPGQGNPACTANVMGTPCASMIFDSRLQRLYVANYSDNSISIFDASTATLSKVGQDVKVGAGPVAIAPLSDGSRVYVLNRAAAAGDSCGAPGSANGQISVISTSNNAVVSCIAVADNPMWLAASSDGTKLLVPHQGGTPGTQVIATATNSVSADVAAPLVDPNGGTDRMSPVFVVTQ